MTKSSSEGLVWVRGVVDWVSPLGVRQRQVPNAPLSFPLTGETSAVDGFLSFLLQELLSCRGIAER
jgi:hypothetical protein